MLLCFSCLSYCYKCKMFIKCNNMQGLDAVFCKFNFWRHRELVGPGQIRSGRVNEAADTSGQGP